MNDKLTLKKQNKKIPWYSKIIRLRIEEIGIDFHFDKQADEYQS